MATVKTASTRTDEEWLGAAMADDAVAAELLVRLKQSRASPLAPPPGWGLRLPRSKPSFSVSDSRRKGASDLTRRSPTTPLSGGGVFTGSRRKGGSDSNRRSPTTPLTWSCGSGSGGGSPAATADGSEESSSGRRASSVGRSKGIGANEAGSISISWRSRKKSFVELQDEDSSFLKERVSLKKEVSTSRATCRKRRDTNESLKKTKLDPNPYSAKKLRAAYDEPRKTISRQQPELPSTLATQPDHHELIEKAGSSRDNSFLLPDLNLSPCEDDSDSGPYTLYGM